MKLSKTNAPDLFRAQCGDTIKLGSLTRCTTWLGYKAQVEMVKNFEDETEARHWVINHLDLSDNWTIELSKVSLIA